MKTLLTTTTLLLLFAVNSHRESDIRSLERVIDASPLVHVACEARTCTISPVDFDYTSQDYRDEVNFIKKHLDGLGVELREEHELSRQRQAQSL